MKKLYVHVLTKKYAIYTINMVYLIQYQYIVSTIHLYIYS